VSPVRGGSGVADESTGSNRALRIPGCVEDSDDRGIDFPILRAIPTLRESIRSIDDDILVEAATPMTAYIADSTREERFRTFLMGFFAIMALLLALAGIFGVTARAVASRSTELGIRLALGARHQSLIGSSVRQNLKLFLLGLGCGLGLSLWTTRFLSGLLFEITVLDPATWVIVTLLFLLVCLLASYLPARRVLRIDPVSALRAE